MEKLVNIEGIGEKYATQLRNAGITDQNELLRQGAHRNEREALAQKTGISYKLILKWVNQADLSRIRGIAEEYAELLEKSGVDTVPELAQRNAEHLHQALQAKNEERNLVRRLPGLSDVQRWIEEAKELPRVVQY